MPDTLIYRVGLQPEGPLYLPDAPNNREGPQAREPSKCLKGRSYGERRAKEASLELQDAQKKTDRAITPVEEAIHVPAHGLRVPLSQAAVPPSCSTLTGAELPQTKKSYLYACRVALVVSDSL